MLMLSGLETASARLHGGVTESHGSSPNRKPGLLGINQHKATFAVEENIG